MLLLTTQLCFSIAQTIGDQVCFPLYGSFFYLTYSSFSFSILFSFLIAHTMRLCVLCCLYNGLCFLYCQLHKLCLSYCIYQWAKYFSSYNEIGLTLVFAYYSYHRFSLINRIAYYMGFYLLLLENQLNNIPGQANTLILFPK